MRSKREDSLINMSTPRNLLVQLHPIPTPHPPHLHISFSGAVLELSAMKTEESLDLSQFAEKGKVNLCIKFSPFSICSLSNFFKAFDTCCRCRTSEISKGENIGNNNSKLKNSDKLRLTACFTCDFFFFKSEVRY